MISLDGIELQEFDYIDIGAMILLAQVVPVVVKSLVFPQVVGPRHRDGGDLSGQS